MPTHDYCNDCGEHVDDCCCYKSSPEDIMDKTPIDKKLKNISNRNEEETREYNYEFDRILFEIDGKSKAKSNLLNRNFRRSSISQNSNTKNQHLPRQIHRECRRCHTVQPSDDKYFICRFCNRFVSGNKV